jgi:hypothetical protein
VDQEQPNTGPDVAALRATSHQEKHMAYVRIEQRNGRLATGIVVEQVSTREGLLAKATVVVISNGFRNGESEATAIRWTLWGKQARTLRATSARAVASTSSAASRTTTTKRTA